MDAEMAKRIEDIMYVVGMTCPISTEEFKLLCWAVGVPFPPQKQEMGLQPPVSAAFNQEY